MCWEFFEIMQAILKCQHFIELRIKQADNGTFIRQTKDCLELLRTFKIQDAKSISSLIGTNCHFDKDENGKEIEITKY